MLCCHHHWTTTTPSGRRDRSFPALSTPTSWKKLSQLPGPRPPVNQILQPPLLHSLHLYHHHLHFYLVRQTAKMCIHTIHAQYKFCTSYHFFSSKFIHWLLFPDHEDSPELPPPPGVSDNRQCVLCLKYGDENTNVSNKSAWTRFNTCKAEAVSFVTCLYVSGGWQAAVHRSERVDPCELCTVVCRGIRGRRWLSKKCAHGCSQGKTAGKREHFLHHKFPLYLPICIDRTNTWNLFLCTSTQRCEKCQKPGATVGCCLTSCTSNYHFMCARQYHCVFLEDKKVYCPKHRDLIKGEVRKSPYCNTSITYYTDQATLYKGDSFSSPYPCLCIFFLSGGVWVWGDPQDPGGPGGN